MYKPTYGRATVIITCADTVGFISQIHKAQIPVNRLIAKDDLTLEISISGRRLRPLNTLADKFGAEIKILTHKDPTKLLQNIVRRPILCVSIILMLLSTVLLPGRIFFFKVDGCKTIAQKYILEKAAEAGIGFGSLRVDVRSEKLKNMLLQEIPELQWVGVNTMGCVAVISVREKSIADTKQEVGIASIVAARDGVVTSCNVTQGRNLCRVGQAVTEGETLVSGYTENGILSQGCVAEAEIVATTKREVKIISPLNYRQRGNTGAVHRCYGIRIGKNFIKFCNHSGIYDVTCVKMYEEDSWVLPGGFTLPVAWTRETVCSHSAVDKCYTALDTVWMEDAAQEYALSQMVAGEILTKAVEIAYEEDIAVLNGQYTCQEMIGQVRYEEILK